MSPDSICDTGSVQSRSGLEDEIKWLQDGFVDGKKYMSKNDDFLQGENDIIVNRDFAHQSLNTEAESAPVEMKKRIEILEGKISKILNRLDNQDLERRDSSQIRKKAFQEMSARIWLLERENKALSDENLTLRLENSEMKEILNKGTYESDIKSLPNSCTVIVRTIRSKKYLDCANWGQKCETWHRGS